MVFVMIPERVARSKPNVTLTLTIELYLSFKKYFSISALFFWLQEGTKDGGENNGLTGGFGSTMVLNGIEKQ